MPASCGRAFFRYSTFSLSFGLSLSSLCKCSCPLLLCDTRRSDELDTIGETVEPIEASRRRTYDSVRSYTAEVAAILTVELLLWPSRKESGVVWCCDLPRTPLPGSLANKA